MGARGVLKLPAHLAAVPDELTTVQDFSLHEAPEMPKGLEDDDELTQLWNEIVDPLNRTGFLSPGDAPVVETLCRLIVLQRRAFDDLLVQGLLTMHQQYMAKNPLWQSLGQTADRIMEISKQLGMTWMVRARTQMSEKPASGDGNPFASTGS